MTRDSTDYNIADQSGSTFLVDLNNVISDIATNKAGTGTMSGTTYAGMWHIDWTADTLSIRNQANDAWIPTQISPSTGLVGEAGFQNIKQGVLNTTQTTNTGTWYDVPNLSVPATPRDSSSAFFVILRLSACASSTGYGFFRLRRAISGGSTSTIHGHATDDTTGAIPPQKDGSTDGYLYTCSAFYVDTPATDSQVTYSVQVSSNTLGQTVYINAAGVAGGVQGTSSLQVIEIAN